LLVKNENDEYFVLKYIDPEKANSSKIKCFWNEYEMQRDIDHPNIVRLRDYSENGVWKT